jgi:hypothetical protein
MKYIHQSENETYNGQISEMEHNENIKNQPEIEHYETFNGPISEMEHNENIKNQPEIEHNETFNGPFCVPRQQKQGTSQDALCRVRE